MQILENKIPPPLVLIVCMVIIWLLSKVDSLRFLSLGAEWINRSVGVAFAVLGVAIAVAAVRQFSKAQTTVNPLKPSSASSMVDSGIFSISRNPMYLGMACVAFGAIIFFGSALSIIGLILFVGFITRFQIIPEEKALSEIFGDSFKAYTAQTRRWI